MPQLQFTTNIQRHVRCPDELVQGATLADCLEQYFCKHPQSRSYVLDDQGALRKHMNIFINREQITDRRHLSDRVAADDEIYVLQALSGGS